MRSPALLKPQGNTVRLACDADGGAVQIVLVANDGREGRRWLEILRANATRNAYHYMDDEDLRTVRPFLHVQPTRVPCFLVFLNGWLVDWFPPPSIDHIGDASAAMRLVQTFVAGAYE